MKLTTSDRLASLRYLCNYFIIFLPLICYLMLHNTYIAIAKSDPLPIACSFPKTVGRQHPQPIKHNNVTAIRFESKIRISVNSSTTITCA